MFEHASHTASCFDNPSFKKSEGMFYQNVMENLCRKKEKVVLSERIRKTFFWIVKNDRRTLNKMLGDLYDKKPQDWVKCKLILCALPCYEGSEKEGLTDSLFNPHGIGSFENTDPFELFPDNSILDISQSWKSIEIKKIKDPDSEVGEKRFAVLDVDLDSSWQEIRKTCKVDLEAGKRTKTVKEQEIYLLNNLELFFQKYFEYRSMIANNIPMKIAINLPDALDVKDFLPLEAEEGRVIERPGEAEAIKKINFFLGLDNSFEKTKNIYFRFHGWTGNADSSLRPETLLQQAALGNNTIGIYPSGAGIKNSLIKNLPDDLTTTPEIYANEIMTLIDFLGLWKKRLFLNGHSLGGAAMYWFGGKIVDRLTSSSKKLLRPRLTIIAENPAIKDTCTFLKGPINALVHSANKIAHSLRLSKYRLSRKVFEEIARIYASKIAPQESAVGALPEHIKTIIDPIDAKAVLKETKGLVLQPDLPEPLINKLNQAVSLGLFDFLTIIADGDLITDPNIQRDKFEKYGLRHPLITFKKDGHFVHLSNDYIRLISQLFSSYINDSGKQLPDFIMDLVDFVEATIGRQKIEIRPYIPNSSL